MRLKHRLALLMAVAAAAPIALVGGTALSIAERSAIRGAEESERREAQATGARVGAEVQRLRLLLRLFARRTFDFEALTPDDLLAAEKLIYGLDDRITATSILQADGGATAPSFYRRPDEPGNRPAMGPGELDDHAQQIPLAEALTGEDAISPIYRNRGGGVRVAVAVASDPSGPTRRRAVVVAEVALEQLVPAVAPGALLFDAEGRLALGPPGASRPAEASPARWAGGITLRDGALLGSFAPVPVLGWGVGSQRPLSEILAPARQLRARIALWAVALAAAALLAGVLSARGITAPLERLAEAARGLGAGDLDRRAPDGGYEEVALAARAFNNMAAELSRSQAELRRWNGELEGMVQARTAELRQAIEQLLVAHRLAAIGQLGAGVAHEINNPLTLLTGMLQLLGAAPPERREEMVAKCLQSARRIQEVVSGLLEVSQPGREGERSAIDVNAVVESALRLVERPLGERGITVERRLGPSLPRILGEPAELVEALVQILKNAPDAMPQGGCVTVETKGAIGDKLVVLQVSDTGRGVPEEHRDRLFDPFFTTRAATGHRGLGLSIAWRIVKSHGGNIHVESAPGSGTRFLVRLPALPRTMSLA